MDLHNNSLHSILDYQAPIITWTMSFTCSAPWFTDEFWQMKRSGCALEFAFKSYGLMVHKVADWEHQIALSKARWDHYSELSNNPGNTYPISPSPRSRRSKRSSTVRNQSHAPWTPSSPLLKAHSNAVSPLITLTCHSKTCHVPSSLKIALIKPHLKNPP